ncbi:DUF4174 domain-containing protein [Yoonia sp.]|uniref:DUF4174 domain-containing protein n=1 Tax=Yoonia sp. TaxID=2212373 RepID=UPI002FDA75CB
MIMREFTKGLLVAAALTAAPLAATAQDTTDVAAAATLGIYDRWLAEPKTVFDAAEIDPAALQWLLRPLVVFADSPNDPRYRQQMDQLLAEIDDLVERDVIIITDTDPAAMTALRTQLRPRGYMMALVAKDGRVALRKPAPWSVRELSRSIDKMPLREQEIRDRRTVGQ